MNRILIIDDDESVRSAVRRVLLQAGYEVETAPDGSEGLRMFGDGRFELVILDIWMPGKNGFEVLTEIRQNNPPARVVTMSGASPETAPLDMALRLGAVGVLTKPFTTEE